MATLQSVIDRAISSALSKGLSSSKYVTVVYVVSGAEVMLVVSYTEPSSVEAPLNLIWVNGDPASTDFKKARKRSSRVASGGFTHTWAELTDYAQLTAQFWDTPEPSDLDHILHDATIGNPHGTIAEETGAVPITGGTMTGPLILKPGSALTDIANDEATPRWWVNLFTSPIQILATQVKQAQAGMLTQINGVRNRVTALENRLRSKGFIHTQAEPALEWNVVHNMSSQNINLTVKTDTGELVIADVFHIDNASLTIKFAAPTAGQASLQAIVI